MTQKITPRQLLPRALLSLLLFAGLFACTPTLMLGVARSAACHRAFGLELAAYTVAVHTALTPEPEAEYQLGRLYMGGYGTQVDMLQSMNWLRRAGDHGLVEAQLQLAAIYSVGGWGAFAQDYDDAALWYRRASDLGNAQAAYYLGSFYQFGQGMHRDIPTAIRWYELAAQRRFWPAQVALGDIYAEGIGVPVDTAKAQAWYAQARALGGSAVDAHADD